VGYDNFQAGSCQYNDTDYAYYQVAVPSALHHSGLHLHSASFQAKEDYSSSCSASPAVTLSWTGGINSGTGWNNKPGPVGARPNAVTSGVGPDPGSCNGIVDTSKTASAPFNVLSMISQDPGASAWTFRLWEPGDTNSADHKQFTDNPQLEVSYNYTPNKPGGLKATANSDGSGSVGCATSPSSPPAMTKTASVHGPYLWASYKDDDGDSVRSTVTYWQYSNSSNKGSVSAGSSLSTTTPVAAQMPASFTSGMKDGTVVAWQATATDGTDGSGSGGYSATSATCYFAVYPTSPDPPAITPGFNPDTTQPAVGSQITFTITQSANDTAKQFVWGLDQQPPTTGTIPAAQTCTTSAATASCTKISGGTATVTITVPSPGPHDLWIY
jgi:hypothetical protein